MNDTGGQVRTLGSSLLARRRGEPVAEDGYQGEYVYDLAVRIRRARRSLRPRRQSRRPGDSPRARILEQIRTTLESLGIVFDNWYSQASVEESGAVAETIELFARQGPRLREGRRDLAQVERARRLARPRAREVRTATSPTSRETSRITATSS